MAELITVDEKTDDRIVHLNGLREADRLPDQALDPRAQCQMFTLQLLGKAFADLMLGWLQMAAIGAPAVGEEPPDAEGLQQRFQLQERLVRKTICFSKTIEMHDTVIGLFINRDEFGRAV